MLKVENIFDELPYFLINKTHRLQDISGTTAHRNSFIPHRCPF